MDSASDVIKEFIGMAKDNPIIACGVVVCITAGIAIYLHGKSIEGILKATAVVVKSAAEIKSC